MHIKTNIATHKRDIFYRHYPYHYPLRYFQLSFCSSPAGVVGQSASAQKRRGLGECQGAQASVVTVVTIG